MTYSVIFKPSAAREFARLPSVIRARIAKKISALATEPIPHGAVKLVGQDCAYRIRIGDYRVVYDVLHDQVVVLMLRVAHRREVYR